MRIVTMLHLVGSCVLALGVSMPSASAMAGELSLDAPPEIAVGDATLTPHFSNRMRGEFADWFDPGPGAAPNDDSSYQFFANVMHFGVRLKHQRFGLFVDGQYVALANLPNHARGLGPGAVYFANNRRDNPGEVFLREGYLTVPNLGVEGLALDRGGRFKFNDGLETIAKTEDPMLQWVKKMRISQRLIGAFDYTHSGRSFDGGAVSYDRGPYNLTFMGGQPTAGGFNVSANPHIDGIFLTYLAATVTEPEWLPRSDMRLFHVYYEDGRDLVATDNRPLPLRQADQGRDIQIHTIGANFERIYPLGPGAMDVMWWVAGQTGDWQSQDHGAWAVAAEAGYRFASVPWTPWMRVGYFRSSGDGDPDDGDHESFFQILPTARLYALTPFFNLMNNQDVFWQMILKPHPSLVVRTDYHYLEVASDDDLVYAGGGATQQDRIFGYGGFPARGAHSMAHFVDLTLIWNVNRHLQFWAYYGHAFGQSVVSRQFAGSKQLDYAFLESTIKW